MLNVAGLTYKKSGVDIDKADAFVETIKPIARRSHGAGVMRGIGGFGAFFKPPLHKYRRPVLVSSTDGVGTKLKCAIEAGRLRGLGIDLVGMNVNDILTCGAEPLFFLDYMAVGHMQPAAMTEIVRGIADGCKESGCSLIGGETAEMPGVYAGDDFDIAGFAVGIVEESKIINGKGMKPGDVIIGCASSGIHSNGFSFVRKAFSKAFIKEHAEEILMPTRLYVRPILEVLKRTEVIAMAHITGGGFYDKLGRVLPEGLGAEIDTGSWRVPRVFKWLQEKSGASVTEMHRTFNMGIGYALVVSPKRAVKTLNLLGKAGLPSWIIGKVVKGAGVRIQ